ncbi:MFS general substrate transporter [Mollisia scopiformis]|uniref:MFS general substrate transporter n=1 Tax=Mollisia scopiformis TaxID=149040 RepID=A0A194XXV7_MOLSC|nr:MFS general substrate transporter [Mollisia scopiformis]KUJ24667.1 MFS general substrate transporter [Mollisia scopiformis]
MQSILQYRRLKKDIGNRLKHDNDAEAEKRNSGSSARTPTTSDDDSKDIVLRNGERVNLPGVRKHNHDGKDVFLVDFGGSDDQLNPKKWPHPRKYITVAIVGMTGFLVGWVSSIDSAVVQQARMEFGVSEVAESLATGLYLIAFGVGSLIAAPLSETVGRNPVYLATLSLLMIFIMASGLAPNIGAQLAFRFIAGLFGCTPLTTFGGSMADMFYPMQRTYIFPICCSLSFLGPFLAPMVGAFIGQSSHISWRWTEWVSLILAGLITGAIFLFVPETYAPILLKWKAKNLRTITGDDRFMAEVELSQESFPKRVLISCRRPFRMFFTEIMVLLFTMYLVIVYIVLFGFLTGYEFIFGDVYDLSQGSTGLAFIGMNVGFLIASAIVPYIYVKYKRASEKVDGDVAPEDRLWYAMYGAPWLPISLFWMAWTDYASVSYWSPLVASVTFGFSVQAIFISTYQYLIDSYEEYAASALVSATFMRYLAAGVMVVVSIPMYKNLGVHWSLTLLGCISMLLTPVPYVFYKYGNVIRERQKG